MNELRGKAEDLKAALLEKAREVVARVGRKVVAADWGVAEGTLSYKLREQNRNRLETVELLEVMVRDADLLVLGEMCARLGCEPPRRRPRPTDAEELAALRQVVSEELGPTLSVTLLDKLDARLGRERRRP